MITLPDPLRNPPRISLRPSGAGGGRGVRRLHHVDEGEQGGEDGPELEVEAHLGTSWGPCGLVPGAAR